MLLYDVRDRLAKVGEARREVGMQFRVMLHKLTKAIHSLSRRREILNATAEALLHVANGSSEENSHNHQG